MQDFLLVGLGNPGTRYKNTRHNVGYMVIEAVAESIGAPMWRNKFSGRFTRVLHLDNWRNLLEPTTYMNLSGQSVAHAMGFYQIQPKNLVVVHDDLDLPFETIRIKKGGGTGGHKGIDSIVQHLGTFDFVRIRLGIGRPGLESDEDEVNRQKYLQVTDYVLENFTLQEKEVLSAVIHRSTKAIECVVTRGVSAAMNEFNVRNIERESNLDLNKKD